MRIVVDTSVVISRLLAEHSVPALAMKRAENIGIFLTSDATISEMFRVLTKPKFKAYFDVVKTTQFIDQEYLNIADQIRVMPSFQACRDPNDDKFLQLAIDGKADVIITSDQDLLTLHPFQGVAILTPIQFLAQYEQP